MIGERKDVEAVGAILEKETQREIRPALEGPCTQFADADAAVDMRLAECLPQFM